MERDLGIRRPAPSKSEGLSKAAKTFFGLNIFQGENLTFCLCILHPHCVTCSSLVHTVSTTEKYD